MSGHSHTFPDWPFGDPVNATAFMCDHVVSGVAPILRVAHDHDGDWQFLCDGLHGEARPVIVCLGCAFERDRSVREVASLPPGWAAERVVPGGAWSEEAIPVDEGGDDA
jgi:hypothetical protein